MILTPVNILYPKPPMVYNEPCMLYEVTFWDELYVGRVENVVDRLHIAGRLKCTKFTFRDLCPNHPYKLF